MKRTVPLNDGWRLGWEPHTAGWHTFGGRRYETVDVDTVCTWPATVPGVVQMDLERHGILPDLYVGTNVDHARWVEDCDWWYCLDFEAPVLTGGRHARLVFHGLDTFATVWLNGQEVGRSENMFIRHVFEVTSHLKPGAANRLLVRLAAPRYSIPFDPAHGPLPIAPERVFVRKAQMSYGWDIAPRLVTVGIWREVELELVDKARIDNVAVRTLAIEDGSARCLVEAEVEWLGDAPGEVTLAGVVHGQAFEATRSCQPGLNVLSSELVLKDAPLWWPVGYGEPHQVEVGLELRRGDTRLDTWAGHAALCTVDCVQEPQPSGATSFGFAVNGRCIRVTGLNYTPLDALFPRVTDAKLTRVLERMRAIGCNMLRVWGGGVYERAHFYRECQRLGILVWQDFMLACAYYPQDDRFARVLTVEVERIVRDLRGYANLAIWCGDNEGDMFFGRMEGYSNRPLRETFPAVLAALDPHRAYIPSSPFTPGSTESSSPRAGNSHCWHHGAAYTDPCFTSPPRRFITEFGCLSLPSLACIQKYLPDGAWPLDTPMWRYHAADTGHVKHWRGTDKIVQQIEKLGLQVPATLEETIDLSQRLQADALAHWITTWFADPEFGGCLVWNVGDCWPQQSDAVIDYLGNEKPCVERLAAVFAACRH